MATVINGTSITANAIDAGEYSEDGQRKFACRAWVNFDGTTTPPTIRASENVSSVTRNSIGIYKVNFTNAMVDKNYAVSGAAEQVTNPHRGNLASNYASSTVDAADVRFSSTHAGAIIDPVNAYVAIFR